MFYKHADLRAAIATNESLLPTESRKIGVQFSSFKEERRRKHDNKKSTKKKNNQVCLQ